LRTRRGTNFWPNEIGDMIKQFKEGDVVTPTLNNNLFMGVVREVNPTINKVFVEWNGGSLKQHDPDEIMLHPTAQDFIGNRFKEIKKASRRVKNAQKIIAGLNDSLVSDFIYRFFQINNQLYLFHWQTIEFAQHLQFEETRDELEDLIDSFIESYQGKYGRVSIGDMAIGVFDFGAMSESDFIAEYRDFLVVFKDYITDEDSDLSGILDDMVATVNKLLYLLTLK
jgi:hypothetical protein